MSVEPHHPDLFWYGIHGVKPCLRSWHRLPASDASAQDKVVGIWAGGREGVFVARRAMGRSSRARSSRARSANTTATSRFVEIAKFFKTGKPPVSEEETSKSSPSWKPPTSARPRTRPVTIERDGQGQTGPGREEVTRATNLVWSTSRRDFEFGNPAGEGPVRFAHAEAFGRQKSSNCQRTNGIA